MLDVVTVTPIQGSETTTLIVFVLAVFEVPVEPFTYRSYVPTLVTSVVVIVIEGTAVSVKIESAVVWVDASSRE